jgi:hypothetical protein
MRQVTKSRVVCLSGHESVTLADQVINVFPSDFLGLSLHGVEIRIGETEHLPILKIIRLPWVLVFGIEGFKGFKRRITLEKTLTQSWLELTCVLG